MTTSLSHADIIPLIGGMALGSERAFGTRPEYLLSFEPFWGNDRHIVNHYDGDVPYVVLDKGGRAPSKVDVVSSTCPCAGLSSLSTAYGADNPANDWMPRTAEYVLGELGPRVYWGENAPYFAGNVGRPVRDNLFDIGRKHGYSFSVYRTKSLLHGVPQVRERSFYFFWKGDRVPLLGYFERPNQRIEDCILSARGNSQREPINGKTPSVDDPYYRFVLEKLMGGITHKEFAQVVPVENARNCDILTFIEKNTRDYLEVGDWMRSVGLAKEAERCAARHEKLMSGKGIMRRQTIVPRDYIGAFVGHYPMMLTHPVEDRYINYREAMTIMGLPQSFQLLDANRRNANHICQNVPVQTAADMAGEVIAALEGRRPWLDGSYLYQYNHSRSHRFEPGTGRQSSIEDHMVAA